MVLGSVDLADPGNVVLDNADPVALAKVDLNNADPVSAVLKDLALADLAALVDQDLVAQVDLVAPSKAHHLNTTRNASSNTRWNSMPTTTPNSAAKNSSNSLNSSRHRLNNLKVLVALDSADPVSEAQDKADLKDAHAVNVDKVARDKVAQADNPTAQLGPLRTNKPCVN